jgi:hypothetical protein
LEINNLDSNKNYSGLLPSFQDVLAARGTSLTLREELRDGKSGAFVALVDCEGTLDGLFVLKIDKQPGDYADEKSRHQSAQSRGVFSGRIPALVEVVHLSEHYCMLFRLAGDSRLVWRPLLESPRLFGSAYEQLSAALWTPDLFHFSELKSAADCVRGYLGYRLREEEGGRVSKNVLNYLGRDLLTAATFLYSGEELPNPYSFTTANDDRAMRFARLLLGPSHGDCHPGNIIIKATTDGEVNDLMLIDFASYEDDSPLFFDHAYLELSVLLSQMEGLGAQRWLDLASALVSDGGRPSSLDQYERAWALDITKGRKRALSLVASKYAYRLDDFRVQFALAHVSAGLSFLNKLPRKGRASAGISADQYLQAFVWSAVHLRRLFQFLGAAPAMSRDPVPRLGIQGASAPSIADDIWNSLGGFDSKELNVVAFSPSFRGEGITSALSSLLRINWGLVVDFCTAPLGTSVEDHIVNAWRQIWPYSEPADPHFANRGTLWYFANGREDISEALPAPDFVTWRRRYFVHLRQILEGVEKCSLKARVRLLFVGDYFDADILRIMLDTVDVQFGDSLVYVLDATGGPRLEVPGVRLQSVHLEAVLQRLERSREPQQRSIPGEVVFPCRHDGVVSQVAVPFDLVRRLSRDLFLVHRNLAHHIPVGREFGIDFRRGMAVEWSELAAQLDVPREKFSHFLDHVRNAFATSGNSTVNLRHEPSAGGTTLSRRIAWSIMEEHPVVLLQQLSADTSELLRDLFQFSSLPLLVVMEAGTVTESEREMLLRELREDNTRAVFLWVSRIYEVVDKGSVLQGQLTDQESDWFFSVYREQVREPGRVTALRKLVSSPALREQRSPFFFGLTAFGDRFIGLEKLIADTVSPLTESGLSLIVDLALVSAYSSDGFPVDDFDELCEDLNSGERPFASTSPFAVVAGAYIKIPHKLIAEKTLAALARGGSDWRADLYQNSKRLLDHLRGLRRSGRESIRRMVETLFITRDTKAALEGDADFKSGGIPKQSRFSPLIEDIGSVEAARALLKRLKDDWVEEPHFSVHYARHLIYEQPREIGQALVALEIAERSVTVEDDVIVHMLGMCHRVSMEVRIEAAKQVKQAFIDIEADSRTDAMEALGRFARASELNAESEYGQVASIQTITRLLRSATEMNSLDKSRAYVAIPFSEYAATAGHSWCLELVARAEGDIAALRNRPHWNLSVRAQNTIAQWNIVYGRIDLVVNRLRLLYHKYQDSNVRRALCDVIIAKYKRRWPEIPQSDLRTVLELMESNIERQGVRDSDVRNWLRAFRLHGTFDAHVAIRRLVDWHAIRPSSVEPAFYLYVLYFVLCLNAIPRNKGYADESNKWLEICKANRMRGQRNWGYEWLIKRNGHYNIAQFSDLPFDPVAMIRAGSLAGEDKMKILTRVTGSMIHYKGPQQASIDLGQGLNFRFAPRDQMNRDDVGKRVSAIIAFTYDGPVGWDAKLAD